MSLIPFKQVVGKNGIGFLDGDWILSKDMSDDGEIGIVQLKHIGNGEFLEKSFKFITKEKSVELGCTQLEEGDLLVSRMADPICRSCILPKLDFTTVTAVDVTIIRPDPNIADASYLNYVLNTKILQNQAKKYSVGTTRERISRRNLEKLLIPLPSMDVQKNIASTLNQVRSLKNWRKEADKLTDDYLRSVFLDMFGDPVENPHNFRSAKLRSALTKSRPGLRCGPFGSALKKTEYVSSGIPVWTMDNIVNGEFSERGCLYITKEKFSELNSYSVENGDIIISRAGTVGKMCVVDTSAKKSIISTNLIKLSLDRNVISPIYFVCLMKYFKGKVGRLETGADGSYTFMNTRVLENLEVPLPPILVQKAFAKVFEQIGRIKQLQEQAIKIMDDLTGVQVQKIFRGEFGC